MTSVNHDAVEKLVSRKVEIEIDGVMLQLSVPSRVVIREARKTILKAGLAQQRKEYTADDLDMISTSTVDALTDVLADAADIEKDVAGQIFAISGGEVGNLSTALMKLIGMDVSSMAKLQTSGEADTPT